MEDPRIRGMIEQLLDTEGQARQLVEEAETTARDIIARARDEARRSDETARREAHEAARNDIEQAVTQAREQREAMIAKAVREDAPAVERSRAKLSEAAALAARCVLGS